MIKDCILALVAIGSIFTAYGSGVALCVMFMVKFMHEGTLRLNLANSYDLLVSRCITIFILSGVLSLSLYLSEKIGAKK